MVRDLSHVDTGQYGLFGSVFDPVHYGHLYAAEAVRDKLGLDHVLMMPARVPPHKDSHGVAPATDRAAMVRLAVASNPLLRLSELELRRRGPSFTLDTVEELASTYGSPPVLILGVDAFLLIQTWHRWAELAERVPFALVARPGYDTKEARSLADRIDAEVVCLIEGGGLDISSTLLRQRIAEGRTIRYLTPDPVIDYLRGHGLYAHDGAGR